MTDEPHFRDDDEALVLAVFRYGVIGPLVDQESFAPGEVTEWVRQIAGRSHYRPGKGSITVTERTVYTWWKLYREGGIEALRPRRRKDRGTLRALDTELLDRAIRLRRENPKRWTSTLIDILRRERSQGEGDLPHRSTLDRHLSRRGASRRQLRTLASEPTIRMQFEHFGDLWVGDFHHGPIVLGPDGRPVTAKLSAFLDHTTRYPVIHRWYLDEGIGTLRDLLLRAFLAWGAPRKLYVDRGSAYRAERLAYSLARIGTRLVHSRPYYSQGRGVIERWWQLAKAFASEIALLRELITLHELNRLWEAFVDLRYLQAVHSAIRRTPAEAIAEVSPDPIAPEVARELFLERAHRTVHRKEATVSVDRVRFLCDASLRGRRVEVRYDPTDFASVVIFVDGDRFQTAYPQKPNARPAAPKVEEPPAPSVNYLSLLREDFDRQLLEKARPLAYTQIELEAGFGRESFVDLVRDLAGCDSRANAEIATFWNTWGPIPESLTRIACEHAVRLHGRGRHPGVALHAVRTLTLAHFKKRKDPS